MSAPSHHGGSFGLVAALALLLVGCTVATVPIGSPGASGFAVPTSSVGVPTSVPGPTSSPAAPTPSGSIGSASPPGFASPPAIAQPNEPPKGAEAPIDDEAWALVARLRAPAYTSDTTDAAIEALARAGIGTFAGTQSTQPIVSVDGVTSPMRVLDWQAHALAVQTWAAASFSGQELDQALALDPTMEEGVPLASQLLAGYVATADTPGGAMARALMAGQDLVATPDLRFPPVVMTFFLSDLATDGGTIAAPGIMPTGRTAALGTICSDAANWVNGAIHSLFDAIKIATPDNLPGRILVGIWNWLVDQGEAFVHRLIGAVTDLVLAQIRYIASGIQQLVQRVAAFLPYAVSMHIEPYIRFVLPSSGPSQSGVFVATVSAGDLPDWPDVLKDCAGVAQVALPSFRPAGSPVTWASHGEGTQFVFPMIAPAALDPNGEARWSFGTLADGIPPGADERETVMFHDVEVHRPEIEDARSSIADRLQGGLPDLIAGFVGQLFAPFLAAASQRLDALLVARGEGVAILVTHWPPDATPSPPAPPTGDGATWHLDSPASYSGGPSHVVVDAYTCASISGPWKATMHVTHDPTVPGDPPLDQTVEFSWSFDSSGTAQPTIGPYEDTVFSRTHTLVYYPLLQLNAESGTVTVIRLDASEDGSPRVDATYQLGRAGEPVPFDPGRPSGC